MENKIAVIGIFIRDMQAAAAVNEILHDFADKVVGRIGIPYREKNLHIISVIMNAESNDISTLAGRLGRLDNVTAKSMQATI